MVIFILLKKIVCKKVVLKFVGCLCVDEVEVCVCEFVCVVG